MGNCCFEDRKNMYDENEAVIGISILLSKHFLTNSQIMRAAHNFLCAYNKVSRQTIIIPHRSESYGHITPVVVNEINSYLMELYGITNRYKNEKLSRSLHELINAIYYKRKESIAILFSDSD